jgi:hypothetical protein
VQTAGIGTTLAEQKQGELRTPARPAATTQGLTSPQSVLRGLPLTAFRAVLAPNKLYTAASALNNTYVNRALGDSGVLAAWQAAQALFTDRAVPELEITSLPPVKCLGFRTSTLVIAMHMVREHAACLAAAV